MSLHALLFLSVAMEPPKVKVPDPELKMVWPWVLENSGTKQVILRGNHLGERKKLEISLAGKQLPFKPAPKHQDFVLPEGLDVKRHGNQVLTLEVDSRGSAVGFGKITLFGSGPGKSELPLEITSQKLVEDKEPNNDLANAQVLDAKTCRVLGQIDKNQDCDVYRVDLKRGDILGVRVIARSKGSLLDPILALQTPDGAILAQQGPKGNNSDLLLFHTAKKDGLICLVIQDAFDSGGVHHGYEVRVRKGTPGASDEP